MAVTAVTRALHFTPPPDQNGGTASPVTYESEPVEFAAYLSEDKSGESYESLGQAIRVYITDPSGSGSITFRLYNSAGGDVWTAVCQRAISITAGAPSDVYTLFTGVDDLWKVELTTTAEFAATFLVELVDSPVLAARAITSASILETQAIA